MRKSKRGKATESSSLQTTPVGVKPDESLSELLDRLESEGLIEQVPADDSQSCSVVGGIGPGPMTRDRRIKEFARHLELMAQRAKMGDCYIIFEVQGGQGDARGGKMPRGIKDRFVQLWFYSKGGFFLEIPNTTLTAKEAKTILRDKSGFSFAESDDPDSNVSRFHPLRREYERGEEEVAAGDMVFILCDLWKLPVDVTLNVTAARAGRKPPLG